jgi:hypothetical protein
MNEPLLRCAAEHLGRGSRCLICQNFVTTEGMRSYRPGVAREAHLASKPRKALDGARVTGFRRSQAEAAHWSGPLRPSETR